VTDKIDLKKYQDFVEAVTSTTSNDLTAFMNRLDSLDGNYEAFGSEGQYMHGPDVNVPLLMTGAMGLSSETGEFMEIVKKLLFQGKPLTDETLFHMKRELGDVIWYWINACRALHLNPNEVIAENVKKLESRYPGGSFDPYYSENRKVGDL
jgi:NTP pyrophosphatase (non-canonical NTP hydrolase)